MASVERRAAGVDLVVITGLSGSGRSTAIRALEDAGYFCIDSLPAPLLAPFLRLAAANPSISRVAVAMDVRAADHFPGLEAALSSLRRSKTGSTTETQILFLDASDERLIARFKETRRRHTLMGSGRAETLAEAISEERAWLAPIRHRATAVLDTTRMTVHDLKREVLALYADPSAHALRTNVMSFAFRAGLPPEADFVFDVRFLDNPHFVEELRDKTGEEPDVFRFVLDQEAARDVLEHIHTLLGTVLPLVEAEGKSVVTIAIGCTGGQHRSVALAIALAEKLAAGGREPHLSHRDIKA